MELYVDILFWYGKSLDSLILENLLLLIENNDFYAAAKLNFEIYHSM